MLKSEMAVFAEAVAQEYDRQFSYIVDNFTEMCLAGTVNSIDALMFSRKLYTKYRMILPVGSEYGKFKMIHDGVLICLYSSEKSVFVNNFMSFSICVKYIHIFFIFLSLLNQVTWRLA